MPDRVYTPSESLGKSKTVQAAVYKETLENQQDMRNHNPRVGGSSPSSATKNQSLSEGASSWFTNSCKLSGECVPEYRRELYARYGQIAPCQCESFKRSVVYFIQAGVGDIKIGTTANLDKRLRSLQSAHSSPLKVLATVEGGREVEAIYHARFAAHRIKGEWFLYHPDIWREIKRIERNAPHTPGGPNND